MSVRLPRTIDLWLSVLLALLQPTGLHAGSAWIPIGPPGGTVDYVAAAPSDSQIVYAASKIGGIFASDDSGTTWHPANAGLPDLRVLCLAVSPTDPGTVYAGAYVGGFKTTNGGASWTALGAGFPAAASTIVIDPSNPATVYAASTSGALVKSTNGGATWSAIGGAAVAAAEPRILAIDPSHTARLFLGTLQGGIFRSADSGSSWTQSNSGLTNTNGVPILAINALAVDPTSTSRLFAGTASDGVFLSTDAGASWAATSLGIGASTLVTAIVVASDGTAYFSQLEGLYARPPGTSGWIQLNPGTSTVNTLAIAAGAVPPLFIGYGKFPFDAGGFARWDGGDSFAQSHVPFLVVASLAADPASSGRALAATTAGTFEYQPGEEPGPWNPPFASFGGANAVSLPPISILFDSRTPGTVYFGAAGVVYRTTDGGLTDWTTASVGSNTLPLTIVRCFIPVPGTSQSVFAGTSKGLSLTSDGTAWSAASADLSTRQVYALAADPASSSTLWAGTDDGVYRSTDSGTHWGRAGTGLTGNVHAVLPAAGGSRHIFAGADAGLFASADGGATWTPAGISATVNALVEDPATGTLFAGTLAGVFESPEGGTSWAPASNGLANPNVLCLALLTDGTLLAGTNGGSVFELVRTAEREPVARPTGKPNPRVLTSRP